MKLSKAKQRYLASIFGRSAEFLISIALIGQLVTGRLSSRLLIVTLAFIIILMIAGTWLTPDE